MLISKLGGRRKTAHSERFIFLFILFVAFYVTVIAKGTKAKTPRSSTCPFGPKLRRNKIQCSHKRFNAKALCKETYGYYLNAKGYNSRVLCEWLMDCLTEINTQPQLVPGLVADPRATVAEKTLNLAPIRTRTLNVWF